MLEIHEEACAGTISQRPEHQRSSVLANTLKSLLVHLDGSPDDAARMDVACTMAKTYGARLTALFGVPHPAMDVQDRIGPIPLGPQRIQERYTARREAALACCHTANGGAIWDEIGPEPLVRAIAERARFADLIIVGQPGASSASDALPPILSEVLLLCGRPMLIMPHGAPPRPTGTKIMIAWNASLEATRSIAAALPLLQRAGEVNVIEWTDAKERAARGDFGLIDYLKLHGVEAREHHHIDHPDHVGRQLLAGAVDMGANLLVVGCHEHRSYGQWLAEEFSHELLMEARIPLLVCH